MSHLWPARTPEHSFIRFRYNAGSHSGQLRTVFVLESTGTHVEGYCFLAASYRSFRKDKMEEVEILKPNTPIGLDKQQLVLLVSRHLNELTAIDLLAIWEKVLTAKSYLLTYREDNVLYSCQKPKEEPAITLTGRRLQGKVGKRSVAVDFNSPDGPRLEVFDEVGRLEECHKDVSLDKLLEVLGRTK